MSSEKSALPTCPAVVPETGPTVVSMASPVEQPQQQNVNVVYARVLPAKRSVVEAYMLGIPLGFLGAHHFYLRRPGWGVLYLFTFGLLGLGWVSDWFRMACLVQRCNRLIEEEGKKPQLKLLSDAYVLWLPPFGIIGWHHFYLGRPAWGVAYMFTFGLLGIGWIIDCCRMVSLVESVNTEILRKADERASQTLPVKRKCDAFVLGVSPLGLLGCHHYYLGNCCFGLLYTFTLGLLGFGWIIDWFRIPVLTKRANKRIQGEDDGRRYLDQAYVLCFPLGFLGLHHFYLRRYCWGLLYLFTFGLLGIGWIIDFFRMPCLVRSVNEKREEEQRVVTNIRESLGPSTHVIVTDGSSATGYQPPAYPANTGPIHYPGGVTIYPPHGAHAPNYNSTGVTHYPPAYDAIATGAAAPPAYGLDNHAYDNAVNQQAEPCPPKNPNAYV